MSVVGPAEGGGDLSEGGISGYPGLESRVSQGLSPIARDVQLVRRLHFGAVLATVLAVSVLLLLLWMMVSAFSAHISSSTSFLNSAIRSQSTVSDGPSSNFDRHSLKKVALVAGDAAAEDASDNKEKAAAKPVAEEDQVSSDQAHLYKMISSYQTSLSTSSVAVISILAIAIVVITVAILRSALDVKPYDPSKKPEQEVKASLTEPAKDQGYALPAVEFFKNLWDLVACQFGKK